MALPPGQSKPLSARQVTEAHRGSHDWHAPVRGTTRNRHEPHQAAKEGLPGQRVPDFGPIEMAQRPLRGERTVDH